MRWRNARRSSNVEDRRGMRARPAALGGGIGTLVIVLIAWYFGIDPAALLGGAQSGNVPGGSQANIDPADDPLADFVSVVLADTEDTWRAAFAERGERYRDPVLVLFTDAVQSACGFAQSAMGPFYCPGDNKLYIDLGFYRELRERFDAPGDFAQAYVIAHEVGHHVQNLLGVSGEVQQMQRRVDRTEANRLSVRLELQADCFAGFWANDADRSRQVLEAGDVEEGLAAASAIGDDRLQRQSTGRVIPDSFTHGSSDQRVRWFRRGLEGGDLARCDTFGASEL